MNFEIKASDLNTKEAKEKFHMNGFLLVRKIYSNELMEKIISEAKLCGRDHWDLQRGGQTAFLKSSDGTKENFFGVTYAQPITSYLDSARELMGCELLTGANHLLQIKDAFYKDAEMHVRQPGSNHSIPAHQDNFYFGLKNPMALTCYVYLTEQSRNKGCLGFLPTNLPNPTLDHELGKIEGFSSFHSNTESMTDEFIYPSTQPGDVIFHHASTFHRADPNKTQQVAASISIRVFSRSLNEKDPIIQQKYNYNLKKNRGK